MSQDRAADWTSEALHRLNAEFEFCSPEEILRWGSASFAPDLALATGFGPEGVVLMHHLAQIAPETTVFYLDTDLLFEETYALRDELQARLGLRFTRVPASLSLETQAAAHGPNLWARNPDQCCYLLKLNPLANWSNRQVWAYLSRHRLPYNRLHSAGYASIGCWPCTRPAVAGADPRSGRWAGLSKTECGIHLQSERQSV